MPTESTATSASARAQPYPQVLATVQQALAMSFTKQIDDTPETELMDAIRRYLIDHGIQCVSPAGTEELTKWIYHDMAGLSFISRERLFEREGFEEININAWNDVEIIENGKRRKTEFSFLSPQHALDLHRRIFRQTKTPFDDAMPRATADIGEGVRITALKEPLVDATVAVASSVRKVNTTQVNPQVLLENETLTVQMWEFLGLCLMHGVSICISGETGAGKTTLAGCLLAVATRTLRTYSIEEGSREWQFVRKDDDGRVLNSVIHTRTRPNLENPKLHIDQEALVKDALRFDPDIIAPGEIRGREAFEVMGVSNTGHTVITTTHSNSTADTPERIVTLAKKAFDMSDTTLYGMVCRAFPILVHMESGPDLKRRVTEIREVTGYDQGYVQSEMLFEFIVTDNIYDGDVCIEVKGEFAQLTGISPALQKRLLKKGARRAELEEFLRKEVK